MYMCIYIYVYIHIIQPNIISYRFTVYVLQYIAYYSLCHLCIIDFHDICVYVCVYTYIHIHMHIYIYICIT